MTSQMQGGSAQRQNTSIEFVVNPDDDLFLEGTKRKLFRVQKSKILIR